jgi:hypothetical protein
LRNLVRVVRGETQESSFELDEKSNLYIVPILTKRQNSLSIHVVKIDTSRRKNLGLICEVQGLIEV